MSAFNLIRQSTLAVLHLSADGQVSIDSLPVLVVKFHLVPSSTGDWTAHGGDFGKVSSKKITIFGFNLHLLVSLVGPRLDFELASARLGDLNIGAEVLAERTDLTVCGDKGYISAHLDYQLLRQNRPKLLTLLRRNQVRQLRDAVKRTFNALRQIIETVNAQLTEQFNIKLKAAHTFHGLCTRLLTKLTAHILCIYLNRLLGKVDFLQIKALAFPI